MRYEFKLHPIGKGESGSLIWDSEIGTVAGELGPFVERLLKDAELSNSVTTHPYPTPYEVKDPRHDPAQFGLVLSQYFHLPEEIALAAKRLVRHSPVSEGKVRVVY